MQLGARWRTGETPHRSVPGLLHAAIAEQEARHPDADSWTLTWLEGRPRCILDGRVFVGLDAHGRVRVGDTRGTDPALSAADAPDADDDDWLS